MGEKRKMVEDILSKVTMPVTGSRHKRELELVEEQYRAIFEYTGTGVIVIAPDLTIIQANHKASELSGYPLEILNSGRKWTEFVQDQPEIEKILTMRDRRLHGDKDVPIQYETTFVHADGSHKHLLLSVSRIPGSDNILSSFIDITDLVRYRTLLEESESRFRETAELLPVIICEFDMDMKFRYVNQLGCEIFNYSPVDILSNQITVDQFFVAEEREHLHASIRRRFTEENRLPEEYRMVTSTGEIRTFLIISSLIMRHGESAGLRSSLIDITEMRRIEESLVEREKRLRTIFDSSPIGITILSADGVPQEMNRAFRHLFQLDLFGNVPLPSLFGPLSITADQLVSGTFEQICGFRFVGTPESTILEPIQSDSICYSWHITNLEESGSPLYLCQVFDITEAYLSAKKRLFEAESMVENLKSELTRRSVFDHLNSRNHSLQAQFEMVPTIASTNATLLITGDSGTGKELLATTVHKISDRKEKPFVAINCGALPENLLESELFGHKAGAFTDAKSDRKGKFLAADGGTLFLDEIGEISSPMQVKLLRVLQERSFQPIGSDKDIAVDVRIIAATNRDLAAMVREGTFREDLYYRIKVLQLHLPPLRDRKSDIPLLVDHFISVLNVRYNKKISGISADALDLILGYGFPGNIRELQNILEHAFVFCAGSRIEPEHLPEELRRSTPYVRQSGMISLDSVSSLKELESIYIHHRIEQNGGNKTETAQALGMHKATLFRKLKKRGVSGDLE